MSELKKCPFCSGKAEFVKMGFAKDIPLGFVRCTECGIRLIQGNCTEDFARDEWNRRKPMDNIVEKLEEAKKKDEQRAMKTDETERASLITALQAMADRYQEAINIVKQEIN